MFILGCLIALYIVCVVVGTHAKRMRQGTYLIAALIALLQTLIVTHVLFNLEVPRP